MLCCDRSRSMHTPARSDFFIRARRGGLVASRAMSLRIGILGAAKIAGSFMIGAKASSRVEVVAVASRDRARGQAFADTHGIAREFPGGGIAQISCSFATAVHRRAI